MTSNHIRVITAFVATPVLFFLPWWALVPCGIAIGWLVSSVVEKADRWDGN